MKFYDSTINKPARKNYAAFALLLVLIITIYSNTLDASWHLDDYQNIQTNAILHIDDLKPATLWNTFFSHPTTRGKFYRPVPCLSFALNWYFGGSNVFGYHLVNIAIHFVTGFFLFLTILHLFHSPNLKDRYTGKANFIALLAAVLWVVNPMQTQAITYIVQRMASMAAMFYIMGIYFFIRARNADIRSRRNWFYMGCLLSFLFALGSKQNSATLPIALLFIEMIFYRDLGHPRVRKFFIPGLVGSGLVVLILGVILFKSDNPLFFINGCTNRPFSPLERLMTEARIVIMYISQTFYPMPNRLSIEHDITISTSLFQPWTTIPSILMILALVCCGFLQMKKRPVLGFAILFFFLNHLIESSIICLELVFEHRNYLPTLFLFFPIALGTRRLIDYYENKPGMYYILISFITLLIIGIGSSTYIRNMAWKDDHSLWGDAVQKAPNSSRAFHNLAWGHYEKIHHFDEAMRLYRMAVQKKNDHRLKGKVVTYSNMSGLSRVMGKYGDCIKYAKKGIATAPSFGKTYYNLASCQARIGKWDEALKNIKRALKKFPTNTKYLILKGFILMKQGRHEESLPVFAKVLRKKPNSQKALINMGIAMSRMGIHDRALWFLKRAHFAEPKNSSALLSLIDVNLMAGRRAKAEVYATMLLDLKGPTKVKSLLEQLSSDVLTVPLSLEKIFPVIGEKIEKHSKGLVDYSRELQGP